MIALFKPHSLALEVVINPFLHESHLQVDQRRSPTRLSLLSPQPRGQFFTAQRSFEWSSQVWGRQCGQGTPTGCIG